MTDHRAAAEALMEKISARATEIFELQDLEAETDEDKGAPAMRQRLSRLKAEQENDRDALSAHAVLAIGQGNEHTLTLNLEGAKGPLTIFTQPDERAFDLQKKGRIRREPQGTGLRSQPIPPKFFEMPTTRIGEAAGRRLSDEDAQELAGAVFTMVTERGGVAGAARLIQHVFDGGSAEDYINLTDAPEVPPTEAHKLINPGSTATVYGPVPLQQSVKVIQKVACPRCGAIAGILCQDDLNPHRTLPVGHYHQERVEAAGYFLKDGKLTQGMKVETPMRDMVDRMVKNAPKPPEFSAAKLNEHNRHFKYDPDCSACYVAQYGANALRAALDAPQEAAEEPDEPSDVYPVTEAVQSDVADAMQAALYWALKPETPHGFNPDASQQARFLAGVLVAKGFDHPSYGRTEREKAMNVTALRQRIGRILQAPRDGVRIERYVLSDLSNSLAKFLTAEGWMKVTGRQEPTVVDEAALAALLKADVLEVLKDHDESPRSAEDLAAQVAKVLVAKDWTKP